MPYALCPMHVGYLMLLKKAIVRLEERTNNLYILAGEAIEIEFDPNG